jgi:hypothetical protein
LGNGLDEENIKNLPPQLMHFEDKGKCVLKIVLIREKDQKYVLDECIKNR